MMFNIRVYGLFLKLGHVLLTREDVKGKQVIKFPGGGLEYGEGSTDCVKREFREELNLEIQIIKHLFTTDFFVSSYFKSNEQILSIYYAVREETETESLQQFQPVEGTEQSFLWIKIEELNPDMFYFPIDKVLVEKIRNGELVL